jgi:tRNA (guanine-N7-)-methyltransferase
VTKNKLERFAEMKTFPNVIEPEFREVFNKDYRLKGKWNKAFFKNDHPIVLELGCGKGEYTVNLARRYSDHNFIGVDIKGARMWRGAKTAVEEGIPNAAFLRTRIDFITSFFAEDEVKAIWVTFPDPQPKKARKRLVSTKFLTYYQHFIRDDATIHLKTDNPNLYLYALAIIRENNLDLIHAEDDVHSLDDNHLEEIRKIRTFYEEQFLEENKKIKYVAFRLKKNQNLQEPPDE